MQTSEHSNISTGLAQQKRAAGFGKDSSSKETLMHSMLPVKGGGGHHKHGCLSLVSICSWQLYLHLDWLE